MNDLSKGGEAMQKGDSGKVAILILLLLSYSALPVRAAEPQPPPAPPYLQQLVGGTIGASLGFLGGGTLGGIAMIIAHQGQLDDLDEAEQRSVVWTILIASGLGIAAGATWGVANAGERHGYPGNVPLAFLGAALAEVVWFQLTIGQRDILEARYPLWPGLGVVIAGLVLPVVGALIGYNL
jgi:uncharacterized membrane protein YfcA